MATQMPRNEPVLLEVFLSYSGRDSVEAGLLQFAIEQLLADLNVRVWTFERDQEKSTRQISQSLKKRVQQAAVVIFLASPSTFSAGAAQWIELAYADAFDVPIYVLLHQLTFKSLKAMESGVPPLLLEGQCNQFAEWKAVVGAIRKDFLNRRNGHQARKKNG